jgi:hypothetical protein
MSNLKSLFLAFLIIATFGSCSDNENDVELLEVASEQVTNLHAPQNGGQGQPISGAFAKFDFSTGEITTSETEWDIAFRGTTIIVNGGTSLGTNDEPDRTGNAAAYIANGTFASITEVDGSLFVQDGSNGYAIPSGSGNGWYLYNPQAFLIAPIAGKVLVFRTRDNKFAKVEILSYYKDAPADPNAMTDEGRYYTFNYIYQPNEGINTF